LDEELLAEAFARYRVVATIEEHSILGGFGGSVAEWLADRPGPKARLVRIGTADHFLHEAADEEYARHHYGLDATSIADRVEQALSKSSSLAV
jgi:transketolase